MTLKIAIQMDPIADIDIAGDTSFALALEAQARGYHLYYYTPDDMRLHGDVLMARIAPLCVADVVEAHFELGAAQILPLSEMDVILMRQDPPFDMSYITATYFLETVSNEVLVVNNPQSVRNAPEKLLPLQFPEFTPPTLITRARDALVAFRATHGDIIIKPIYGYGGTEVFHLRHDDNNFNALIDMFLARMRAPLIAQKYISAVESGDKRVILIDGVVAGVLNRVPETGDVRSNMRVGGIGQLATLTAREGEISARVAPVLRDMGIIFAGLDIIGDYLTEINVTSPTGIRAIKTLGGADIAPIFWDAVNARLS